MNFDQYTLANPIMDGINHGANIAPSNGSLKGITGVFEQPSGICSAAFPFPSLLTAANIVGAVQVYGIESLGQLPSPLALNDNIRLAALFAQKSGGNTLRFIK